MWRRGHRIIEIGAVEVNEDVMGQEFHSFVATDRRISKDAYKVYGITPEMLAGQPKPENVFTSFQQFISNSTLVAHNAEFDITFLKQKHWRLGKELYNQYRALDDARLTARIWIEMGKKTDKPMSCQFK